MICLLKDVACVQSGHPFRGSIPEVPDGNAFALQMRDLTPDGTVTWAGLVRTLVGSRKEPDWLVPGDVVFVARGLRNYAVCMDEIPVPTVCSQYFYLLRSKTDQLLPEFLAWQINRAPAQRYLAKNAEGSDQLSIRRTVLEDLPVSIPPRQVQHVIIAIQRAAQAERKTLENLMRNREQQLDAVAFSLFSEPPTFGNQK